MNFLNKISNKNENKCKVHCVTVYIDVYHNNFWEWINHFTSSQFSVCHCWVLLIYIRIQKNDGASNFSGWSVSGREDMSCLRVSGRVYGWCSASLLVTISPAVMGASEPSPWLGSGVLWSRVHGWGQGCWRAAHRIKLMDLKSFSLILRTLNTFVFLFLFLESFLNICAVQRPSRRLHLKRLFFLPTYRYGAWVQPSLTTRDRELVSVLEVRIEPGDLNPRPLTPESVTLPTTPRAVPVQCTTVIWL